jgi:hypothetical protein
VTRFQGRAAQLGIGSLLGLVVFACFGDPPPAAEDLPLEIVVHPSECILNYPRVGPGSHEVTVIFERTGGSVRILEQETEVFVTDSEEQMTRPGRLDLRVGDYTIECTSDNTAMRVLLEVREGLAPGGG